MLTEVIEQALMNIDSRKLLNTFNISKYGDKVLKRIRQFEMYKALEKCLPVNINIISRSWCIISDEEIVDLNVHESELAIELLLNGKGMQEYHKRFQDSNVLKILNNLIIFIFYQSYPFNKINLFISSSLFAGEKYTNIPFSEYMLLDIRQTTAVKRNKFYTNTLHIKTFTSFRIQDIHIIFNIIY